MGIQRNRLVLPSAQRLSSSADIVELSRSRTPPRDPERQRGLWSFLTWPFVLAPIAAAAAFVPQHGYAQPTDQQDDSGTAKSAADAVPAEDAVATDTPSLVNEQPQEEASDTSRLVDVSRGTFHGGHPSEQNYEAPPSGVPEIANSSAGAGAGGGGGGGPDLSSETQSSSTSQSAVDAGLPGSSEQGLPLDEISKALQPDTVVSSALDQPAIGTVKGALGSELSTIVSGTLDEISKAIPLNTLVSSALDHVEPTIGTVTGALGSGLSTIVSGTSDGISNAIPLNTLVSSALDHVEPTIGTVTGALGSELSTIGSGTSDGISNAIALDPAVSSALDQVEPTIGTVTGALGSGLSTIVSGTPIGLPVAGDDTPINLKDVLGFDLHIVPGSGAVASEAGLAPAGISLSHSIGDLGFVASLPAADGISALPPGISHEVDDLFTVSQVPSDLDNLGDATSPNQMGLAKASTQADLGPEATPADLAARTASYTAITVHTVGEATDVTPGHSLEFSTPPSSEGRCSFPRLKIHRLPYGPTNRRAASRQ